YFPAANYARARLHLTGLSARAASVRLHWQGRDEVWQEAALQDAGAAGWHLELAGQAGWQGPVRALELELDGAPAEGAALLRLELLPPRPSAGLLLRQLWQEWWYFRGLDLSSPNVVLLPADRPLLPSTLALGLWALGAGLCYWLLSRGQGWRQRRLPLLTLFAVGWLLQDGRWQWELWRQLPLTYQAYAGRPADQPLSLHAVDERVRRFAVELARHLPSAPTRILLIGPSPADLAEARFRAARTRYHLVPHNTLFSFERPPAGFTTDAAAYIVLLKPWRVTRYQADAGQLVWPEGRLPARLLWEGELGLLLQVDT
ncbi:MAG TPA: hypothetical protein VNN09_06395, partial [Candidatus Competibacteraceae bacterium]|nr:hypothetical protein [Candidatus Competibacteraceae bacterium]